MSNAGILGLPPGHGVPRTQAGAETFCPRSTGSAINAYRILIDPTPPRLVDGMEVVFRAHQSSVSGNATLEVVGFGRLPLFRRDGSTLVQDDLLADAVATARFDQRRSCWQVGSGTGSSVSTAQIHAAIAAFL